MAKVDGQILRRHREDELDLSPEEAAGMLQISQGYLRNIENGHDSDKLSWRLIGRISRTYHLTREVFVIEAGDEKDPSHPPPRPDKPGPKREQAAA